MKTFANVYFLQGIDWHDTYGFIEFLKQDGTYEIKDKEAVIFQFAKDQRDKMLEQLLKENREVDRTATNAEIEAAIRTKSPLTVITANPVPFVDSHGVTTTDHEITLEIDLTKDQRFKFIREYGFGQWCSVADVKFDEIEEKNIRYLACENFLCPVKGVPSIERFYHEPFTDYGEFMTYYDQMNLHPKDDEYVWARSMKERLIIDVSKYEKDEWFQLNMAVIRKIKADKDLDKPELFRMHAREHLQALGE